MRGIDRRDPDLDEFLESRRKTQFGADSDVYTYWIKQIGDPERDAARIAAVSPLLHVEQIKAPILLIHGDADEIVPYDQSKDMKKALDKSGRQTRLITLEDEGHSDWSEEDEKWSMTADRRFRQASIGPGFGCDLETTSMSDEKREHDACRVANSCAAAAAAAAVVHHRAALACSADRGTSRPAIASTSRPSAVGGMGRAEPAGALQPEPRRACATSTGASSIRASRTSRSRSSRRQPALADASRRRAEEPAAAADQGLAPTCRRRFPRRSATPTTARCSPSRRTSTPW